MGLVIHIDGGSRGNPGPAGAGVVIQTDAGLLVHEGAYYLGTQTNNAAEYYAVIRALERLSKMPPDSVAFRSDSELLVRQVTGQYQVKSPALARLFGQVQRLLLRVGAWQFRHIPRAENSRADELANIAMDEKKDVVIFDVDASSDAPPEKRDAPRSAPGDGTSAATPTDASADDAPAGRAGSPTRGKPRPDAGPASSDQPISEAGHAKSDAGSAKSAGQAKLDAFASPPGNCPRVRVSSAKAPGTACPARGLGANSLSIGVEMPAGVCVHAAQAIIPTLIGVQNTDPSEIAAVPTLTVRCGRPGCGATFHVGPEPSSNGVHA